MWRDSEMPSARVYKYTRLDDIERADSAYQCRKSIIFSTPTDEEGVVGWCDSSGSLPGIIVMGGRSFELEQGPPAPGLSTAT